MTAAATAYNGRMQSTCGSGADDSAVSLTPRGPASFPRAARRRAAVLAPAVLFGLGFPALPSWAAPGDGVESVPRVATTVVAPSSGAASLTGGEGHAVSALTIPIVSMPQADEVIVHKGERRLYLMRHGQVLRSYRIALGLDPQGPKERAGDFRTPEGHYLLTRRNPRSDYFLSIQVSYPNDDDVRRAHHEHVDPGGSIMVHGLPNTLSHKPTYYSKSDWTDGCIALSDSDMVEVWLMTRDNTPIEILP